MIRENISISMAEATEYLKNSEVETDELKAFIKKFVKTDVRKAKELRDKIAGLNLMKVKSEQISKIIDLLPEDAEDLNKIFVDVSLDEDETKKILDTIKEIK